MGVVRYVVCSLGTDMLLLYAKIRTYEYSTHVGENETVTLKNFRRNSCMKTTYISVGDVVLLTKYVRMTRCKMCFTLPPFDKRTYENYLRELEGSQSKLLRRAYLISNQHDRLDCESSLRWRRSTEPRSGSVM